MIAAEKIIYKAALVFGLGSFLILMDYLLPTTTVKEALLFSRQDVSAGARGTRITASYKAYTTGHSFYVDTYTFVAAHPKDTFLLEVSPLFQKVHSYQLVQKVKTPTVSFFRRLIGLLLPLLAALLTAFSCKFEDYRLHMTALFFGVLAVLLFI